MKPLLLGLQVTRFQFECRFLEHAVLPPYKGSTLRGGLGQALQRVASPSTYRFLFDPECPDTIRHLMGRSPHQTARPYVLEPPLEDQQTYRTGDLLCFGMVLIGQAIQELPILIRAIQVLGGIGLGKGRARFMLERVWCESETGQTILIYPSDGGHPDIGDISSSLQDRTRRFAEYAKQGARCVQIRFATPTRLQRWGKLTDRFEFRGFLIGLLRRLEMLSYLYSGDPPTPTLVHELKAHAQSLIEASGEVVVDHEDFHWWDWERYSHRQRGRMKLGGLVGTVVLSGPLSSFLPYLKLAEYVHVGKNTAFGLGQISVTTAPELDIG